MKAKVKTTGEVIEVSQTENIITKRGVERQYVDNKRSWCTYVQSELEFIKEEPCKTIDWEQRRYEIAKDMMTSAEQHNNDTTGFKNTMAQAQYAIECADALNCGGTNILKHAWVDANTLEFAQEDWANNEYWCEDCNEVVDIAEEEETNESNKDIC